MTDDRECTACGGRPGDGWTICHGCVRALEDTLVAIGDAYDRLDASPGRRGGGRGSPGFRSSPAANLDVVLLTDPRTRATREDRWAAATVNALSGYGAQGTDVPRLVRDLRGSLDWIASQDWADECLRNLDAHLRELQRVTGDAEPGVSIGPCPVVIAGDGEPRECGGRIRGREFGHVATCGRCGYRWVGPDEWVRLGHALGPVELDAAELARYFGHPTSATVRSWAHRDDWPRRRSGGRTVFPLHAAVATWARINAPELATESTMEGCERVADSG